MRSEAYVIFPLIVIVLLIRRQFTPVFLLSIGTLMYCIIGYFYNGDFLWLLHQNQSFLGDNYPGAKGELLHYVKRYEDFMGTSLSVLILLGLISGIIFLSRFFAFPAKPILFAENIFLIYGSFFACLTLHTLSCWYPGMINNLGMMRYMITLVPAAALIALQGLNLIFSIPAIKSYWRDAIICAVFSFFIIYSAVDRWYFPFKINGEEKVIKSVGEWYQVSDWKEQKVYYMHNFLPFSLGADPFSNNKIEEIHGINNEHPEKSIEENAILIWDAHYGPHEKNIDADVLLKNSGFILLKHFLPEQEFNVFDGRKFEVYVFQRKGKQ